MNENKGRVDSVIEFRGNFLELLIVAIAIALAIHLFGNVLGSVLTPLWSLFLGAALIGMGCAILVLRATPRINRKISLEGLFPVSDRDKQIISIDRYGFSEELHRFFRAMFHENKAIERIWLNSKLEFFPSNAEELPRGAAAKRIACEAIEYFVLDRLSLDLGAYFINNLEIDDRAVVTLARRAD